MPADKTADTIKLNLRLPRALHKRLVQQAKRNNVSLNTEIVNQLQGHDAALMKKIEPMMINASSGAAMVVAETVVGFLKPEQLERFKEEIRKAAGPPSHKAGDDDERGREKK